MNRSVRAAAAVVLTSVLFALPGYAAAETSLSKTTQLLPPGGNACPAMIVDNAVLYIYNNELDSFDVIIRDASYVAVSGQVGEKTIPFRYMTRFSEGSGVRIHVDVDAVSISKDLPVQLTLLSSPQGQPTCLSVVGFTVAGTGKGSAAHTGSTSTGQGKTTTHTDKTPQTPSKPVATSSTSTPGTAGSILPTVPSSICSGNGSLQLWFLILAIYIVIVALTALAQPPLTQRSSAIPLALILVPLVGLIAFWYFAPACRAAAWIPTVALLAAIAGLLAAFREQNPNLTVIPLPAAKTPAPKATAAVKATKHEEKPAK